MQQPLHVACEGVWMVERCIPPEMRLMALNIKNPEVERLAEELSRMTGETKTETIRRALAERRARLRHRISASGNAERVRRFLEAEVWARIPPDQLGRAPDREERETILGYGEEGV